MVWRALFIVLLTPDLDKFRIWMHEQLGRASIRLSGVMLLICLIRRCPHPPLLSMSLLFIPQLKRRIILQSRFIWVFPTLV